MPQRYILIGVAIIILAGAAFFFAQKTNQISESQLLGAWKEYKDVSIATNIEFSIQNGEHVFRSYQENLPSCFGTWKYDGALSIQCGGNLDFHFRSAQRKGNTLILTDDEGHEEQYNFVK